MLLLQQTGADKKAADRKEKADAIGPGVSESDDFRKVPQRRVSHRMVEQHRENRNRSPTI